MPAHVILLTRVTAVDTGLSRPARGRAASQAGRHTARDTRQQRHEPRPASRRTTPGPSGRSSSSRTPHRTRAEPNLRGVPRGVEKHRRQVRHRQAGAGEHLGRGQQRRQGLLQRAQDDQPVHRAGAEALQEDILQEGHGVLVVQRREFSDTHTHTHTLSLSLSLSLLIMLEGGPHSTRWRTEQSG